jgi:hypothetical protein
MSTGLPATYTDPNNTATRTSTTGVATTSTASFAGTSLLLAVAPPSANLTLRKPNDYQPIINNPQNNALQFIIGGGFEL